MNLTASMILPLALATAFMGVSSCGPVSACDDRPKPESPTTDAGLSATKTSDGVLVTEDGQPVLFYQQKTKSLNGTFPRANYVHPLYALDRTVLTEDFPADHLHHRGVFWTWHQTTVGGSPFGDPWICKDFEWDVTEVAIDENSNDSIALVADVLWKSPLFVNDKGQPRPVARERVTIRIHAKSAGRRRIDFEIQLTALTKDVMIGGDPGPKGYGGFSPRVKLPSDLSFFNAQGPVEATTDPTARSPWMCFTGSFNPVKPTSFGLLCHPLNPGYPESWIIRNRSKSMQNPVYPGRVPIALPTDPEHPLVLRYRIVLFSGTANPKNMADEQTHYLDEGELKKR